MKYRRKPAFPAQYGLLNRKGSVVLENFIQVNEAFNKLPAGEPRSAYVKERLEIVNNIYKVTYFIRRLRYHLSVFLHRRQEIL